MKFIDEIKQSVKQTNIDDYEMKQELLKLFKYAFIFGVILFAICSICC